MAEMTAIAPLVPHKDHLALIGGLPSSLSYFAGELCRDMLVHKHGACEVIALNDLGATTTERILAATGPVLFLAEVPGADVVALARDAAFPVIVVEQGFAEACHDFIGLRGADPLETARTLARAQVGFDALAEIPRATILGAQSRESAVRLAEHIAAALGIEAEHCRLVVEARALERPLPDVLNAVFVRERALPYEDENELFGGLDRFYGIHPDRELATLEVPVVMLLEATAPHLSATNTIDLLGPARCLTFGPYLYLPEGRWRANFTFQTGGNESTNTLGFDIACDQEIKVDRYFDFHQSGKFAFTCEFETCDPFSPLEFRTFLRRGSIGGEFRPLSLTLEQLDDDRGTAG